MVPIPFPVNTLYKLLFLTCQALSSSSPSLLQDVGSDEFDLKMTKGKFAARESAISDLPWHHWLTEDAKKTPRTLTHSHGRRTHFLLRGNQVPLEMGSFHRSEEMESRVLFPAFSLTALAKFGEIGLDGWDFALPCAEQGLGGC